MEETRRAPVPPVLLLHLPRQVVAHCLTWLTPGEVAKVALQCRALLAVTRTPRVYSTLHLGASTLEDPSLSGLPVRRLTAVRRLTVTLVRKPTCRGAACCCLASPCARVQGLLLGRHLPAVTSVALRGHPPLALALAAAALPRLEHLDLSETAGSEWCRAEQAAFWALLADQAVKLRSAAFRVDLSARPLSLPHHSCAGAVDGTVGSMWKVARRCSEAAGLEVRVVLRHPCEWPHPERDAVMPLLAEATVVSVHLTEDAHLATIEPSAFFAVLPRVRALQLNHSVARHLFQLSAHLSAAEAARLTKATARLQLLRLAPDSRPFLLREEVLHNHEVKMDEAAFRRAVRLLFWGRVARVEVDRVYRSLPPPL